MDKRLSLARRGAAALGAAAAAAVLLGAGVKEHEFKISSGQFVEACTCHAPCGCELTGLEHGCQGVGAIEVKSGRFDGQDISGAKIAYAARPGEYARLYIDPASDAQREAVEAFARAAYSKFGTIESVRVADVRIDGGDGKYTVAVDDGRILSYQTEPVLGGDGKTPVTISNINNKVNPVVMQGRVVSCTFKDGDRSFQIDKGRNSYFQSKLNSSGRLTMAAPRGD